MAEIRPSVWAFAGASVALALALPWLASRDGAANAPVARDSERAAAPARVWPPPSVSAPPPVARRTPPPAAPTREDMRRLWDAEDEAGQLASRFGLDAGFEIAMPPRRAGESADDHRRRGEALRRQALADVVLTEQRIRDYYESSELPNGGLMPQEYRRRFQVGPRNEDPRARLELLRRASERLEAERGASGRWPSDAS